MAAGYMKCAKCDASMMGSRGPIQIIPHEGQDTALIFLRCSAYCGAPEVAALVPVAELAPIPF